MRLIERKVCNRHRFRENLGLALRPVPRIRIGQDELPPGPIGGRGVGSVEE